MKVSVATLALALAPWCAHAAGLGKLTLFSALGEPLRAEIELTASGDEYASIAARLAAPAAFKNAGIDYAPELAGLRFSLEQRPNGQRVVAVTSERPVNDPFIDMLVELNWASGRLVREYTFLLDPPDVFRAQIAQPQVKKEAARASAEEKAAPASVKPAEMPAVAKPAEAAAPAAKPAEKPAAAPAAKPAEKAAAAPAAKPREAETTRTVKSGDTLGKIAIETRPEGISLDQMLVALFRSNPDAFEGGNMNRLRAGKILNVPDKDAVTAVDEGEAHKTVVAQAADFNAYRKKLATLAAAAPARAEAPQQAAAGKITPRVAEKTPAPAAGKDKLEVSRAEAAKSGKAAAPGKGAVTEEDLVARDRALKDANARIAQLEKNLGELRKLAEMKSAAGAKLQDQAQAAKPAAPAAGTKKPEPPAPKPAESAKPAEPPKAAPAPVAAEAPKPAEVVPAAKKPALPPPPAEPPPSFIDENQQLVFGGAGILALLLSWFGYNTWRKKREAAEAPLSTAGGEPTASVFGATAGQSVDTGAAPITDFSQDSAVAPDQGVDPVAEADVYMAYGRDGQAEEILLEALKNDPARTAIHLKLLEIYAARQSLQPFEAIARELHALTGGEGDDWDKAARLGRSIDPANPLYGAPAAEAVAEAPAAAEEPVAPAEEVAPTEEQPLSLDFDLDAGAAPAAAEAPAAEGPAADEPMSLDFDLDLGAEPAAAAEAPEPEADVAQAPEQPAEPAPAAADAGFDFDLSLPAAEPEAPHEEVAAEAPPQPAAADGNALDFEFDLDSALGTPETAAPAEALAELEQLAAPELEPAAAPELEPASGAELEPAAAPELEQVAAPELEHTAAAELEAFVVPEPEPAAPELDLSSISLELDETPSPAPEAPVAAPVFEPEPAADFVDDPEVATKLELAQAYEEMGDKEGARELLNEVLNEGSPAQREMARAKLAQLG